MFLDKYTCEDAQEFQDVEFEILDGYYFDPGFCTKIKTQVEVIFNKRLEAKIMVILVWQMLTNFCSIAPMEN